MRSSTKADKTLFADLLDLEPADEAPDAASRLGPTARLVRRLLLDRFSASVLQQSKDGRRLVVVARVPSDDWDSSVQSALESIVREATSDERRSVLTISGEEFVKGRKSAVELTLVQLDRSDVAILLVEDEEETSGVADLADVFVDVPGYDAEVVADLLRVRFPAWIGSWPADIDPSLLKPAILDTALDRSADPDKAIGWMRMAAVEPTRREEARSEVPRFSELHGFGEAKVWGQRLLESLAAYRAGNIGWRDVDRGLLLAGPTGTGKTTFAASLAAAAGCAFVATSYAQWQATGTGHLGDVVRSLRKVFADAARKVPAIVFIDEIDSLPSRDVDVPHSTWWRSIINALLETIDGVGGREGIVVLAACNRPDGLDPALLRAGRLDRIIHVGLPNAADLARILRQHSGSAVDEQSLEAVALAIAGAASGADAARIARDARHLARSAGRPLLGSDLIAAAIPDGRRPVGLRRRIAVHEAGHAVAAMAVGEMPASLSILPLADTGGTVSISLDLRDGTRADFTRAVVVLLAGRAAEDVLLGEPGGGSGGSDTSDLAQATDLLRRLESDLGLGGRLSTAYPRQVIDVEPEMRRLYGEAKLVVARHREPIDQLAQLVLERRVLGRRALEDFAIKHGLHV